MNNQRYKAVALSTVLSVGTLFGSVVHADKTLDSILEVGQAKTTTARQSQKRIDRLAEETASLLADFKVVNKQIEGLRVYNAQMEKQISSQLGVLKDLQESIDSVTIIERQIQPLILRMLDALEQFVELDVPFHPEERKARLAMLRNSQERADISVAEKFRQVLEAYKIEAEYGRKLDSYKDKLDINGQERKVNILRVGRIALMYQTTDTERSGVWDQRKRQWVELDSGEYRSAILKGLRIAKKQATVDIMNLPILAPEAVK